MLLRSVSKHVKDQNWFAVGVDFVIVVIGVFIGIQVSNWNDVRQQRQREAHYLERLDLEFDVIRERLVSGTEVFERSVRNIDFLAKARRDRMADSDADLPTDQAMANALNGLTSGRVPASSPAAFQEMVASGALETLTSVELRQALFAFDEFAGVALEGWRTIRDEQHVAANGLIRYLDVSAPERLSREFDSGSAPVFDVMMLVSFDRKRFYSDPDVQGNLAIMMRCQTNQYTLIARQLALAEKVEAIVAELR